MPGNNTGGASFFQKKGLKPGGRSTAVTYPDKPKPSNPKPPSSLDTGKAIPAVGRRKPGGTYGRLIPIPTTWDKGQKLWQLPSIPKIGGTPGARPVPRKKSSNATRKKAR
jgi:hypothetical protein